jgi:hypothetical protein
VARKGEIIKSGGNRGGFVRDRLGNPVDQKDFIAGRSCTRKSADHNGDVNR